MPRHFPVKHEKYPSSAFFFLFLYAAASLIRPHEMFLTSREWILIKGFAILAFLITIFAHRPIKLYPQHWMILGLTPLIPISGFLNGSGMVGIEMAQKLFVSSIIPLFLFSTCLTSMKRQHWLMVICIAAAMFMVHNGHSQQTGFMGAGWALDTNAVGRIAEGERRITYLGFFNDPNDLGMFLVMTIPFVVYFFNRGKFLTKIAMLGALAAILYGVYMTDSRGTALGAGALIGIYFLVVNAGPKLIIICSVLAPVAAIAFTALQRSIDESANQRLEAWYHGVLMLISNPVFGVGKNRFMDEHGRVAHNSFIHIAAELGVPGYSLWGGALVFTLLTGYLFIKYKKSQKEDEDSEEMSQELSDELALNKTLFFSLIGFIITAFFLSRSYTLLLFIFMGMALASHIRVVKLKPELEEYFNGTVALKSMAYSWIIILVVYMALKLGL